MKIDSTKLLRQKHIKVTPQRVSVLNIMTSGGHFTGEQIYNVLKRKMPSISLSTVYSTLEVLEKNELVTSFEVNGMKWFESKTETHVNVFCINENKVMDVDLDTSWFLKELRKKGIKASKVSIVAHSICNSKDT
ncbi:MAG: transcriptional repressor [Candidatus Thermoplasmatota archaeon]|jgi:Fe2+ or Zn2+ uptake regulation protein|nr:transcriptional repressor [Candidatus Thermoplasmatota archaeon]